MWNNLLKLTLASYLWKRYRLTIIALPLLLLYFWLVNLLHQDIVTYATLQEKTHWLGWSFLIKWFFIIAGIGVFVFIHIASRGAETQAEERIGGLSALTKNQGKTPDSKDDLQTDDAFESIRRKKTLRSKADVILQKKS